MRIKHIKVDYWRHFKNVEVNLDDDAGLVCIVGANGTGKSHLLELIACCAYELGLSGGIEITRGSVFADRHKLSIKIYLAKGVSSAVEEMMENPAFLGWDRTLTLHSESDGQQGSSKYIEAGGTLEPALQHSFPDNVVNHLRQAQEVHFLSLDADRAYPNKPVQTHDMIQAYEIQWDTTQYTRGRSFATTLTLYDEWLKYILALENQAGAKLLKDTRKARESCEVDPIFDDHFKSYRESVAKVLPHIVFSGVDTKSKNLLFNTAGLEVSFNQLSGGEREIAFLIGQIERFGLRNGLFLIDEPELHLNPDLIRRWMEYLMSTVQTGQIWLATHSLEAVEVAGPQATYVMERNDETRLVDKIDRLDCKPLLSALSRSLGSPAFSISSPLFVFVEGQAELGERERFARLVQTSSDVRFIECGSCNEVARQVAVIKTLAHEAKIDIKILGIVDSDFKSLNAVASLESNGLYILDVHEVENFFLNPDTLTVLMTQNGLEHCEMKNVI